MQAVSLLLSHSCFAFQCQLESVEAHMHHQEKKKLKPRCLVYFRFQNMTDEKWRERENILGCGDSFETLESTLQPISASQACSGALWEVRVAHCCVFRRRGRENERKWQQMKLAGCEVLFSPACSNEQAFRTHWRNWSPVGPEPSLFHLSGVFTTCGNNWKHTHTCGSTCWAKHCLHALIHSYCKKALVYDQVVPFHSLVSLWWCISSASSHAATMPLC